MELKTNQVPSVNKSVLLAVTMLSNFFTPLMGAAVNVALPKISAELSMNAVAMSWVTMSYLLSSAVFLVPFGKIGDIFGRKKIFLYGNIFFTAATLICAFAFSDIMLISGRFLQGIGSSMMFSTSMAIVISAFPPQERGKVIGFNVSAVYLGLSAAPILGGFLTDSMGWRSLFYLNAASEIFIIAAVITKIKGDWTEDEKEKFDITGSIIYMIGISTLMYGLSKLTSLAGLIFTIAGLISMTFFVIVEKRLSNPVLNMKLFIENRVFAFSNLSALINYAATFAITFILSLYLQYVEGLSPRDTGFILVAQPAMMAAVASFSGRLSDKIDPRILASIGMAISVVGLFMMYFLERDTSHWFIVTSLVILGIGFGLFSSPNTNSIMSSVEKKFLGVASATLSTMRISGMMFSMAIASLSLHIFIGDSRINESNLDSFILSSKAIFLVFTLLCILGVFASMVGIRKKSQSMPD